MTYSIIQKSQLEGAHRLDAEYYQPEYLDLEEKLYIFESKKLFEVARVTGGKRLPVGELFSKEGVPYLRVVDMCSTFIDISHIKYISERLHKMLTRYQIQKKDILVTIVGNTVGLVGYNQYNLRPFNFTENCAQIRAKEVVPEFLLAVLLSRIGQLQVGRERVGTAQPKLSLDRLRHFFVPVPSQSFQEEIKSIVDSSLKMYEDSILFYSQAEHLLLEELGSQNFREGDDLFSVMNLSDVKNANRMDAEFFQQKYEKLSTQLSKHYARQLGDLVTIKKGLEPGSEQYQERGKLFIRVSSLSKFGITDKDQKYLNDKQYNELKKDYQPKKGEILLTKDATPGVAYVLNETVDGIVSGGIFRLQLKEDIEPEYLALCINSMVGQMQVERDASGSIIAHWKPNQVKAMLIPILPKSTQQKIADLVRQSHAARKNAKELLAQAQQTVEEMIENNSQ